MAADRHFPLLLFDGNAAFADVDLNASGLLPLQAEAEGVRPEQLLGKWLFSRQPRRSAFRLPLRPPWMACTTCLGRLTFDPPEEGGRVLWNSEGVSPVVAADHQR